MRVTNPCREAQKKLHVAEKEREGSRKTDLGFVARGERGEGGGSHVYSRLLTDTHPDTHARTHARTQTLTHADTHART